MSNKSESKAVAPDIEAHRDFTTTIAVDQTPEEAFKAITSVRGWWIGEIDGPTDKLAGQFTYRYKNMHYSKQEITELVPGKRIVWDVVESALEFVKDKHEWNGTRMTFDITTKGGKTEVRFTHTGMVPSCECYSACSNGWRSLIDGNLRSLIATGKGQPSNASSDKTKDSRLASTRAD